MLAFLTKLTIDPQGLKEKIVDLYEDGFMTSIMLAGSSFLPGKVSRVLVRPGIFPDYEAPVVRNAPDGTRAVHGALGNAVPSSVRRRAGHEHRNTRARTGGAGSANRCLVPWTSFASTLTQSRRRR